MFDEKMVELPAEAPNDFVFQQNTASETQGEQGKTVNVYNYYNVYPNREEEPEKKVEVKPEVKPEVKARGKATAKPSKMVKNKPEREKGKNRFGLSIALSVATIVIGIVLICSSFAKKKNSEKIIAALEYEPPTLHEASNVNTVGTPMTVDPSLFIDPRDDAKFGEQYSEAMELYEDGKFAEAANAFLEIFDFRDSWYWHYLCKFECAKKLVRSREEATAGKLFLEMYQSGWLKSQFTEEILTGMDYGFDQVTSKSIGYWNNDGAALTFVFFDSDDVMDGFFFRETDENGELTGWVYFDAEGNPIKREFMVDDGYLHVQDLN